MLINPEFDEAKVRDLFGTEAQDIIRFVKTDDEFVMYVRLDATGKEEAVHGFQKVRDGVYLTDLNPHVILDGLYGERLVQFLWREPGYEWTDKDWYQFGVADSPEQLLGLRKIRKAFVDSPEKFILCCTPIIKSAESAVGGWRWHKWGPYMGKQKPTREYLYDEPEIEEVIVYHFYGAREVNP